MEKRQILIAVPARNEASTIAACIRSIDVAARRIPGNITVVVAADSCGDATAATARGVDVQSCGVSVIEGEWGRAGATRAAAVDHGLAQLGSRARSAWIANTDADCVVSPSWLRVQTTMAHGVDAIGGIVRLDPRVTDPLLLDAFDASYELDGDRHPHVHGANIGVSVDAYRSVGGWCTNSDVGEDHVLWDALVACGHRVRQTTTLCVLTSARVRSRVVGGFATNLANLRPVMSAPAHV